MTRSLFILSFLAPFFCFGQEMAFKQNKIFYKNEIYKKSEVNSFMLKSPEAYRLYHKSLEHRKNRNKYFWSAALTGGATVYVVTELRKVKGGSLSDTKPHEELLVVSTAMTISASAIFIALGLSSIRLSKRYMKRAVDYYNWEVHKIGQKEQSFLELNLTDNGVGLAYSF